MFVRGGAPCGFRVWDFWGWGCTLHSELGATVLQKAPPLIDTCAGNASENERVCTKLTIKTKDKCKTCGIEIRRLLGPFFITVKEI